MTDASAGLLAGKRLLILGAGHFQLRAIRCAQRLGCTVTAVDYLADNPGHRVADRSEVVSTVDLEAVLDVARRHAVDGVMTYASDVSVPAVAYVAERLGLPGNPSRAAAVLQRKDLFRAVQRDTGLPHPRYAAGADPESLAAALAEADVPYPVLVKPADSSGSKGQSVAARAADLPVAFSRARPLSRCGVVVAETVLGRDLLELDGDALVQDGRVVFAHYGHNYFVAPPPPWVPAGEMFPGFFGEPVIDELDRQLQAVVDALGIRTGCLNFDGLLSGGQVHILEIGLRNGGYFVPDAIALSTGVDLTEAAVKAALGVAVAVTCRHVADPRPAMTYAIHSDRTGSLRGVRIDPSIERYVVDVTLFVPRGGPVRAYTRGDYLVGMLLLQPPDLDAMRGIAGGIGRYVTVELD